MADLSVNNSLQNDPTRNLNPGGVDANTAINPNLNTTTTNAISSAVITDTFETAPEETIFAQANATTLVAQANPASVAGYLGVSDARKAELDRQADRILGGLTIGGLDYGQAAVDLRNNVANLSTNERQYFVHALTERTAGPNARYGGTFRDVANILGGDPALSEKFSQAFNANYERGWTRASQVGELVKWTNNVDRYSQGAANPQAVVNLLKDEGGQRLRRDLAVQLQAEGANFPEHVLYAEQSKANYYAATASVTRSDSNATRAVVERLANDPTQLRDFFLHASSATTRSFLTDVTRARTTLANSLTPQQASQFQTVMTRAGELGILTQHQVEDRRAALTRNGLNPENTGIYDATTVVPTLLNPANRAVIEEMAARYGIEPELLAGVVASEMDFDHDWKDALQDGLGRNIPGVTPGVAREGAGVASVHLPTLERAIAYVQERGLPGASAAAIYDRSFSNRASFQGSVEAAAIVTSALRDWKVRNGDTGRLTTEDMAVIWSAYRTGVGGFLPDKDGNLIPVGQGGFRNGTDFALNRANGAQGFAAEFQVGGNAYQSLPYFRYFQEVFR
jgi:hypothetical protein